MSEVMFSDKTFDSTITEIATKFSKEFSSDSPPFITLINPDTQCFHYYGKKYYERVISNDSSLRIRIPDVIRKVFDFINNNEYMKLWYRNVPDSDNDSISLFLDLLLNTPISLNYGVVGQIYHTRIPRFFYTADMFRKYSGVKKFIKEDLILKNNQSAFKKIIEILEGVFWKEDFSIGSAIVAPISLFGQIAGIAFVSAREDEQFDYYDYLRFLQLTKELSITLIKDAKEFEFLSDVIKKLQSDFDVVKALLKCLPIIFNITGACLKYKDEEKASCLLFCKQPGEKLPEWQERYCVPCIQDQNKDMVIRNGDICPRSKDGLLQPRSNLKVFREIEGRSFELFLYYDVDDTLINVYKNLINLELDDALKLLVLEKENREKVRKIELQSHLLSNYPHITLKRILPNILDAETNEEKEYIVNFVQQRGFYLNEIGKKSITKDSGLPINICKEITLLKKYNLFRNADILLSNNVNWPSLFETNCKSCKYSQSGIKIKSLEYGKGALYTIFENILHNAIFRGDNIIESNGGKDKALKSTFKMYIKCTVNENFVLMIGDTTSPFPPDMKNYYTSNPFVVDKNNSKGLGLHSTYMAGIFLSANEKTKLVFRNEESCINECGYTYIFYFPLEKKIA